LFKSKAVSSKVRTKTETVDLIFLAVGVGEFETL